MLTQNGSFTLPAAEPDGSAYAVSVSTRPLFPQRCSITSGSGTVSGADVTNVSATCTAAITESVLYSFAANTGPGLNAGLRFDGQGNLYGTTINGGTNGYGTVFEIE